MKLALITIGLLIAAYLPAAESEWIPVEPYNVTMKLKFSEDPHDSSVVSTYEITLLQREIPDSLNNISGFKVEIILESGYSIIRVLDKWTLSETASPAEESRYKTVVLSVDIRGWDYWELDLFAANVWYKPAYLPNKKKT